MKNRIIFPILISFITAFSMAAKNDVNNSTYGTSSFMKHFTWGVDAGSSIDISNNDLSTIDTEAFFGYKNNIVQALGVGVGLHSALGNSFTLIPVYAIVRTNLSANRPLCFVETRLGYSFNSFNNGESQNGIYCSAGLGFNLYTSEKVKSHIVLSYSFSGLNAITTENYTRYEHSLSAMSVKIGISF